MYKESDRKPYGYSDRGDEGAVENCATAGRRRQDSFIEPASSLLRTSRIEVQADLGIACPASGRGEAAF